MRTPIVVCALTLAVVVTAVPAAAIGSARAAPTVPATGPDAVAELRAAVADRLRPAGRSATTGTSPLVAVQPRSTDRWGFGSVVLPAPARAGAYPRGWLYVARREGGRWRVGLEGEPVFAELAGRAPILRTDERRVLGTGADGPAVATRRAAPAVDRRTGMRLPFAVGQRWRYTSGPHPMNGSVRSSIDLAGGDGRVLAARAGLAYTMCPNGRGWVRVVHDRGLATDYYHLARNVRHAGVRVAEGTFLGMIGNDVSCGGASTGRHVHFSLLRDGRYEPIDGYNFGKWVIRAGSRSYGGTAWHGSQRVRVGGVVTNHGALGLRQGIVDTDGGTRLNRRAGPGVGYRVVGTVPDGATVTVRCSRRGSAHAGRNGYTSDLWNRLTDGTWISDVYLWTGTGEPVNGYCP